MTQVLSDTPLCSVARASELTQFATRLEGADRTPLFLAAPAGLGKTTLLKQYEDAARRHQWRVISETAGKNSQQRLAKTYLPALWESLNQAGHSLESFTALPLGQQLEVLARVLLSLEAGLLITVDDVRKSSGRELEDLLSAAAHLAEQNLPLQLVFAGRPPEIRGMMAAHAFAATGCRIDLCSYNRSQTEDALAALFARSNRRVCAEMLAKISIATKGHPFMVHLLGHHLLETCPATPTEGELETGIECAQQSLGRAVFEPMLEGLSEGDRAFLGAMASDTEPSKMSDIAARLGKNPQYAGVYRNRLVEAHLIRPASYGKVTFAVPHLREYLRRSKLHQLQDFEF